MNLVTLNTNEVRPSLLVHTYFKINVMNSKYFFFFNKVRLGKVINIGRKYCYNVSQLNKMKLVLATHKPHYEYVFFHRNKKEILDSCQNSSYRYILICN